MPVDITEFGLSSSHRLQLSIEGGNQNQSQFIEKLKSLKPDEEKQIHHQLSQVFVTLSGQSEKFNPGQLSENNSRIFNDLLNSHPIECLHFLEDQSEIVRHLNSEGKKNQKEKIRFINTVLNKLQKRLDTNIVANLVYLGALKQVYSAESVNTDDYTERIIIQGIIGLIHERINKYQDSVPYAHGLLGVSEGTINAAKPADRSQ